MILEVGRLLFMRYCVDHAVCAELPISTEVLLINLLLSLTRKGIKPFTLQGGIGFQT